MFTLKLAFFRQWVSIINVLARPYFSINFTSRIACNNGIGFYILRNDRACTNSRITSNMHILNQAHMWTNINIIANDGRTSLIGTNGKELTDVHIVPNHCSMINDHTLRMSDEEAISNLC